MEHDLHSRTCTCSYHDVIVATCAMFSCSLVTDLRRERHKKACTRKALEQDWFHSMKEKQQFLLEELQRAKEQGILLHQQCEKYQR